MISSLSSVFKHGPQKEDKTPNRLNNERIQQILDNWTLPSEVGCTDLYDGMGIDVSELCSSMINQDPGYTLKLSQTSRRYVPGSTFDILDDNMQLRGIVQDHLSRNNWRIKLDVTRVDIHRNAFGCLFIQIIFTHQTDDLFNYCPKLLQWFVGNFDILVEIGKTVNRFDYYPQGNIYLTPNSLLNSRT